MKNFQNGHILNPEFTSIPAAKAHPPKRRDIQGLRYFSIKICSNAKLYRSFTKILILFFRAWAIILVLLFHYFPGYFPNGYVGVDMWVKKDFLFPKIFSLISNFFRFFVISGYLIGMIVCKFEVLDRQALQTFYYRRAKV